MLSSTHNERSRYPEGPVVHPALRFILLTIALGCQVPGFSAEDKLDQARKLLLITDMQAQFESAAVLQTREILRTYASIVDSESGLRLPASVASPISACYAEVYTWDKFASGIAGIMAEILSSGEMDLLSSFYSDRSIPPNRIDEFKAGLEKAAILEASVADYIASHSADCQDRSLQLIREYVAAARAGSNTPEPDQGD